MGRPPWKWKNKMAEASLMEKGIFRRLYQGGKRPMGTENVNWRSSDPELSPVGSQHID